MIVSADHFETIPSYATPERWIAIYAELCNTKYRHPSHIVTFADTLLTVLNLNAVAMALTKYLEVVSPCIVIRHLNF